MPKYLIAQCDICRNYGQVVKFISDIVCATCLDAANQAMSTFILTEKLKPFRKEGP